MTAAQLFLLSFLLFALVLPVTVAVLALVIEFWDDIAAGLRRAWQRIGGAA